MDLGVIYVFLGPLFVLLLLGVPVGFVLMFCSVATMFFVGVYNPITLAQYVVQGVNNFSLMAIPFFVLAGEIMAKGGLSRRIVAFAKLFVGRIRGGLGYTMILAAMLFAGLSGAAGADMAAIGGMLIPLMVANGYQQSRSTALAASSALMAPIIPPSTNMILMGSACGLSITKMFMGGIFPGILMALGLMFVWFIIVRKDNYHDQEKVNFKEAGKIVLDTWPALGMPVLIIGGIRLGWFTPTEAGAFSVIYAILVCTLYYRELGWKELKSAFLGAGTITATLGLMMGGSQAAGYYMTLAQVPAKMALALGGLLASPYLFLFAAMGFIFIMGMIMDITPNTLIFSPILVKIAVRAGIDPYFFSFVLCLNLQIGMITPPVGGILFIASRVGNVTYKDLVVKIWPFGLAIVIIMLLIMVFPDIYMVPLNLLTK